MRRAAVATLTGDDEWAAKRACARLSDSHIAAFHKDGFIPLRKGVPSHFEDALVAVQLVDVWGGEGGALGAGGEALRRLAVTTPPRALVCVFSWNLPSTVCVCA